MKCLQLQIICDMFHNWGYPLRGPCFWFLNLQPFRFEHRIMNISKLVPLTVAGRRWRRNWSWLSTIRISGCRRPGGGWTAMAQLNHSIPGEMIGGPLEDATWIVKRATKRKKNRSCYMRRELKEHLEAFMIVWLYLLKGGVIILFGKCLKMRSSQKLGHGTWDVDSPFRLAGMHAWDSSINGRLICFSRWFWSRIWLRNSRKTLLIDRLRTKKRQIVQGCGCSGWYVQCQLCPMFYKFSWDDGKFTTFWQDECLNFESFQVFPSVFCVFPWDQIFFCSFSFPRWILSAGLRWAVRPWTTLWSNSTCHGREICMLDTCVYWLVMGGIYIIYTHWFVAQNGIWDPQNRTSITEYNTINTWIILHCHLVS